MTKNIVIFVAAIMVILGSFVANAAMASPVDKVTICHVPPGNPSNAHTITNGRPALKGHFDNNGKLHGLDYMGPCVSDNPTETPSSPVSSPTSSTPTSSTEVKVETKSVPFETCSQRGVKVYEREVTTVTDEAGNESVTTGPWNYVETVFGKKTNTCPTWSNPPKEPVDKPHKPGVDSRSKPAGPVAIPTAVDAGL